MQAGGDGSGGRQRSPAGQPARPGRGPPGRPLVDLGGPQQRAVIAHLALDVGRVVSVERLIDRLWGDEPPGAPLGALQSYVSRLRRVLEPGRPAGAASTVLVSEAPGYVLRMSPASRSTSCRFETLRRPGATPPPTPTATRPPLARFDAALALWRGPALAGLGPDEEVGPIVAAPRRGARRSVAEDRFDALLALGRHAEVVGPLQEAVAEHPLRERRWAQLALALYRSRPPGRRAAGAGDGPRDARRPARPRPGARAARARAPDPRPGPGACSPTPGRRRRAGRPARPSGRARGPAVGRARRRSGRRCAAALAGGRRRGRGLRARRGRARHRQDDAARRARRRGGRRAAGRSAVSRCAEPGLAPTLWPWIEVVRTLIGRRRRARRRSTGPRWRRCAPAAPTGPRLSPVELADRIAELLRHDVADGPRLLVLDDLHWADAPRSRC